MNVSIIVFSPSGHTLKAANMIKRVIESHTGSVRLINVTGKKEFLYGDRIKENLERELGEYDVLFIGGPTYAGHIEHHLLDIIGALPFPDKRRSNLAVPFITYGGVHSSIALEEIGEHLKKQKYKSVLGIKLAAKHTLTVSFSNIIYSDRPGPAEEKIISEVVKRVMLISQQDEKQVIDQSESFKYAPAEERAMFHKYSQEMIHSEFKNVAISTEKCIACKKCISVCPVNMFHYSNGIISIHREKNNCILCAECFHNCPVGAIEYPYIKMARKRLKDGFAELENVPSAIYPANLG